MPAAQKHTQCGQSVDTGGFDTAAQYNTAQYGVDVLVCTGDAVAPHITNGVISLV
jgi:hypothetical protein